MSPCSSEAAMHLDLTVLSLSFDINKLGQREAALRAGSFDVVSVTSGAQARFEIEMGRCGIFLTGDQVPAAENRELLSLFRQNCPRGSVIFVSTNDTASIGVDHMQADVWIRGADDPQGIVEYLRSRSSVPKAS